jgi:hypothetical protein
MNATTEARFDADQVYREEIYTDRRMGTIRAMVPVKSDGTADTTRPTLYLGQVSVMTPMGTLPISFELAAENLQEAIAKFAEGAQAGVEEAMRELQQMRRESASSLVLPESAGVPPSASRLRMP